jgi:hypothetical protein
MINRIKECIELKWMGWSALRYIFSTEKQRLAWKKTARRQQREWLEKHVGPSEKDLSEILSQPPLYSNCGHITWLDESDKSRKEELS